MFDAFELQPELSGGRKRLIVAFVAATVVMGLLTSLMALVTSTRPLVVPKPKQIDVAFKPLPPPAPEIPRVEPPPPPPPRPQVAKKSVAPSSSQATPTPAAKALVAPTETPLQPPAESEVAVAAVAVEVGASGDGTGTGLGSAAASATGDEAPVAKAQAGSPINLPEEAEAPEPLEDNAQPEYPESARSSGLEAKVVLKVVVELDGSVGRIQILKGQEPFTSAALAVVKTWKYQPARLEGQPISVFKIVNITFALRE